MALIHQAHVFYYIVLVEELESQNEMSCQKLNKVAEHKGIYVRY